MECNVFVDSAKKKKNGGYSVFVIVSGIGKRLKVFTGMTSSEKFVGRSFPKNEPNGKAKTSALGRKIFLAEKYYLEHEGEAQEKIKDALKEIISGKEHEEKAEKAFVDYVDDFVKTKDRRSTAVLYELTSKKVREFDAAATFDTITPDWLRGFEKHFSRTMRVNGLAIQLRNIRTVFNWAIDNEWTNKYPFRRFKIKQEKAAINNISVEDLRILRDYDVEEWQAIYRDFFMLSFYLCGINPGDLLMLKKSDMKKGRITYRRQKTGRLYDIPVIPEALEIIRKYSGKAFLLSPMDHLADYHTFNKRWNVALKKIGPKEIVPDKLGKMRKVEYHPILPDITVYTARYTFASIGAELDIPRETIALCLGHAWADVTSHYIAYDRRKIDEAVKRIANYVNSDLKV